MTTNTINPDSGQAYLAGFITTIMFFLTSWTVFTVTEANT